MCFDFMCRFIFAFSLQVWPQIRHTKPMCPSLVLSCINESTSSSAGTSKNDKQVEDMILVELIIQTSNKNAQQKMTVAFVVE